MKPRQYCDIDCRIEGLAVWQERREIGVTASRIRSNWGGVETVIAVDSCYHNLRLDSMS
jgi:hypothetical protein